MLVKMGEENENGFTFFTRRVATVLMREINIANPDFRIPEILLLLGYRRFWFLVTRSAHVILKV